MYTMIVYEDGIYTSCMHDMSYKVQLLI